MIQLQVYGRLAALREIGQAPTYWVFRFRLT